MNADTLCSKSIEKSTPEKTLSEQSSKTEDYLDQGMRDTLYRLEKDSMEFTRLFYKTRFEHLSAEAKTASIWYLGLGSLYGLIAITQVSAKDYVLASIWGGISLFSFLAAGYQHGYYLDLKEKLARIYSHELK